MASEAPNRRLVRPREDPAYAEHPVGRSSNTTFIRHLFTWSSEHSFALIFICLTASFVLKVLFISGPSHGSDDIRYLRSAEKLLEMQSLDFLDHAASRVGFLLVIVMPAVIAGKAFVGGLVNAIICLFAEVLVVRFAYRTLGLSAAAICAAFVCFSGLSLTYSGIISPDPLLALLYLGSSISLYRAAISEGRERIHYAAWSGLLAGLAYTVKDTGILLLVPGTFCLIAMRLPVRDLQARMSAAVVFLLVFFVIWLSESLIFYALSGDFFYRIHAISEVHNKSIGESTSLLNFVKTGLWSLHKALSDSDFLMIPAIAAVFGWTFMLRPRTSWPVFSLTGFFTAAFLFFGTSSLSRLVNLPYQDRYLMLLFPIIGIGIAYLFAQTHIRLIKGTLIVAVALNAVLAVSGAARRVGDLYFEPFLRDAAIATTVAMQMQDIPVFVDKRTHQGLRYFMSKEKFSALKTIPEDGTLPVGYYVIHPTTPTDEKERKRYDQIVMLPIAFTFGQPHNLMARFDPVSFDPKYRISVHVRKPE